MGCDEVLRVDLEVNPENALDEAYGVLKLVRKDWKRENIKHKVFENGITNKLFGFHNNGEEEDVVLVRVNGIGTEIFLDRKAEVKSFELMHEHGCAPNLYCIFSNGLSYQYVHGEPITRDTVRQPQVYKAICKEMAKMHSIPYSGDGNAKPAAFSLMRKLLATAFPKKDTMGKRDPKEIKLENEINELESHLMELKSPVVFCHNDLLVHNIIYNEQQGKVTFIDYEYAAFNYEAFDIGNHFCEFAGVEDVDYSFYPDETFQRAWLRNYLEEKHKLVEPKETPSEEEIQKQIDRLYVQANKFSLAANLSWGIWALVQAKYSKIDFDFAEYSKLRLDEYYKRKRGFLAL